MDLKTFISKVKRLERLAELYTGGNAITPQQTLGYLRQYRYNDTEWNFAAAFVDESFIAYVKKYDIKLADELYPVIKKSNPEGVYFGSTKLDIIHILATTNGYLSGFIVPDYWTGWGGDCATGMSDAQKLNNSYHYITAKDAVRQVIGNSSFSCSKEDIEGDADAIKIANLIIFSDLWEALEKYYYTDKNYKNRYEYLAKDIYSNFSSNTTAQKLAKEMENKMRKSVLWKGSVIDNLEKVKVTDTIIKEFCKQFSEFILNRV